ncbi:MAG: TetR family transcriptional regulator [Gammaproteobacteria bacterium]|nr:TetR family transcriptional regulator [Gammaproteobacteria bacterium]
MTAKITNLREQFKTTTRQELTRVGLELFLQQGFATTTIDQIVEPLGISKRTFFRYFATKEDLVVEWQTEMTPAFVDELNSRPREEAPFKAVSETLLSLASRINTNPQLAFELMRLFKETPSLAGRDMERRMVWEQALTATLIEREGPKVMPRLKARITVGMAMTAWTAALDEWYLGGGKANLRPIMEKAFSLVTDQQ